MKHLQAPVLAAGIALSLVLLPARSPAAGYNASIHATATVVEPLGITGSSENPDAYLMAPAQTTAFVLFEAGAVRLARTVKADSSGIVFLNSFSRNPWSSFGYPAPDTGFSVGQNIHRNPALVTIILTEN